MIDYHNHWMNEHIDPLEGISEEERMLTGCFTGLAILAAIALLSLCCWLFSACTPGKVVTVPEVHEHWHHTTDTILRRDSVIDHRQTIIREVDSATMAQYGIQMSAMQTAWLIQTDRMQRELSELRQTKADTIQVRDSVPVPCPVIKEVKKPLTGIEKGLMGVGVLAVIVVVVIGAAKVRKFFLLP